jgi:hypothetical protein
MKYDWKFSIKKHGKTLYSKTWVEHGLYFWSPIRWIKDYIAGCRTFGHNPLTIPFLFLWAEAKAAIKDFWELLPGKRRDDKIDQLEARVKILESRHSSNHGQKPFKRGTEIDTVEAEKILIHAIREIKCQ